MEKINKDIPLPEFVGRGRKPLYPWRKMEVGDSFDAHNATIYTISPLASQTGKRLGMKFVCRTEGDCVRVWRVS